MQLTNTNLNDVSNYIDTVLNIDKSSWKTNNDVPTPMGCVDEMLSKIPDELWSRRELKILDPCCGNGNFLIGATKFLQKYHSFDESLNCLYGNDLNSDRVRNANNILSSRVHFTEEDFLTKQYNNKFDLIMANPPYAKIMEDGTRASKNHHLTQDFIMKSLELLNPNGYLVYILPNHWMSLADRNHVSHELTKRKMIHLNIHLAKKWFPKVGSTFTWFVVQNTEPDADYEYSVEGTYNKHNFQSLTPSFIRNYMPLYWTREVHNILLKTIDNNNIEKFKVETSSDLHRYTKRNIIQDSPSDTYCHRLIHTPKQTVYASRPHKYQNGWKIFLSTTDKYKAFVDNCGMTQSIAFIRCNSKEEAELFQRILEHPLYHFLNNITRWGNFNCIRILQRFPKSTQEDVYRSFEITNEEQKIIENFLH